MIFVNQTYADGVCRVSIKDESSNHQFAYYTYNNGQCINKVGYSLESVFNFDASRLFGVMRIQIYLRDTATKEIKQFLLDPIKLNRFKYELSDLSEISKKSFDADIYLNNTSIPAYLNKKDDAKRLFIFFNGAIDKESQRKHYPFFNRISWAKKFDGHCLYLYDQSLNFDAEYMLGWYRGSDEHQLHGTYVELIKNIAKSLGVTNKDLYFYGSSGGGFAALKFAESFPDSTAIAINAQTNCLKYEGKKAVEKFKSIYTNYADKNSIEINPDNYGLNGAKMIIVQNIKDDDHYENHFKPIWSALADTETGYDRSGRNYAILYDHESGHGGETPEVFEQIMKLIH